MAETGPYLDKLNRDVAPDTVRESNQWTQVRRASKRWERFLRMKSRMSTLPLFRQLQFLRRGGKGQQLADWAASLSYQREQRLRQQKLEHGINESERKMQRYMTMAQYAIHLAVASESNPKKQYAKRQRLSNRWRNIYQRVMFR